MKIKGFFLFLVCSVCPIFSAGPIVHLWVAERFCEICGIIDRDTIKAIIVGSEFPDIRYITRDSRSCTHPETFDLQEVLQGKTAFEVGMKLHVWVDVMREKFIASRVYYAVAPHADRFPATLLKFIEEEIMSDFYDGRRWSFCFDEVLLEELEFTNREMICKWHGMIKWTISVRPSWLLWGQSYRGSAFGVPVNTLYDWSSLLPQLKHTLIFQHHLYSMLSYLEEEIKRFLEAKGLDTPL